MCVKNGVTWVDFSAESLSYLPVEMQKHQTENWKHILTLFQTFYNFQDNLDEVQKSSENQKEMLSMSLTAL
jgi:hypothetical protein